MARAAVAAGIVAGLLATVLAAAPAPAVPTGTTTGPVAVPSSDPGRSQALLVRLVRSGGFAGFVDRVVVTEDGRVRVTPHGAAPEVFTLRARQLVRLRTALRAADLPGLKPGYPAPGADMFEYAVTADGVTVTATETAVPAALRPVIGILLGYLAAPA